MSSDFYRLSLSRNLVSVGALAYRENSAHRLPRTIRENTATRPENRSLRPIMTFVAVAALDQIKDAAFFGRSSLRALAPGRLPVEQGS